MNKPNPFIFTLLLTFSLILGLSIIFIPEINSQSDKISLCHRTKGLSIPWVAIQVSTDAQDAHLNHADFPYNGTLDPDGNLPKDSANNWCLTNDPNILPPPPTLLRVDSSCQVDSQNALLRVENPTTDYLGFEVATEIGGAFIVNSSLTPGSELLPTFGYWVVPVARNLILQTFLLDPDTSERTALEQSTIYLPTNPVCTFLTYCYNGVTYSLLADGSVNYPPEGSTDGACLN